MADLSPFVIEKCIQSIVGHPKNIKKLKSGDLLLEVDRKQQVENLLNKKISNDQELIQSDPTSCPQNQKGNN